MSADQDVEVDVGDYLAGLMKTLLRASPGPLVIRRSGAWHEVAVVGGAPIAKFTRGPDSVLFVRAWADLRVGTAALVEVVAQHRDDGSGCCGHDGQQVPCTTRRLVISQLGPRIAPWRPWGRSLRPGRSRHDRRPACYGRDERNRRRRDP